MNNLQVKAVLRSLLISYSFTAVLLVILAFLLYQFHLGEKQIGLAVDVIYVFTCLIGGFIAGKTVRQRRFLWGILAGSLYFLILLAVSFALQKGFASDTSAMIRVLAMCAGGGMIGGMIS
ncbi:TIGR04086 family membrane protein [Lachnospiraceae bacterium 62-35]